MRDTAKSLKIKLFCVYEKSLLEGKNSQKKLYLFCFLSEFSDTIFGAICFTRLLFLPDIIYISGSNYLWNLAKSYIPYVLKKAGHHLSVFDTRKARLLCLPITIWYMKGKEYQHDTVMINSHACLGGIVEFIYSIWYCSYARQMLASSCIIRPKNYLLISRLFSHDLDDFAILDL